jgi:predicted Zn-dependent protease
MHKKFKILIISVLIMTTFVSSTNNVFATPTFGTHRYYTGVGNVTVYIDRPSGAGYWQNFITNAANNWMYTGVGANPIYMRFVSGNNGSTMDIYAKKNSYWIGQGLGSGILAETLFYDSNNRYFNPATNAKNWVWTEIYINDDNFRKSSFSNDQALGTIIHEMGHAWGLAHTSDRYSIMCQTGSGRAVQRVQKQDNDAVNWLY